MLKITVPETEYYDEQKKEFVSIKETTLQLEHSLIAISKWESKWKKPFLGMDKKTYKESLDYIRCMTITQNVNPLIYQAIPASEIDKINGYIDDTMTATWFKNQGNDRPNRRIVTAELIYYWMFSQQIPLDFEKRHLNTLFTLIRVCNEESAPSKKVPKKDILAQNYASNLARRQQLNTHG